jgi:hypothetical protein
MNKKLKYGFIEVDTPNGPAVINLRGVMHTTYTMHDHSPEPKGTIVLLDSNKIDTNMTMYELEEFIRAVVS